MLAGGSVVVLRPLLRLCCFTTGLPPPPCPTIHSLCAYKSCSSQQSRGVMFRVQSINDGKRVPSCLECVACNGAGPWIAALGDAHWLQGLSEPRPNCIRKVSPNFPSTSHAGLPSPFTLRCAVLSCHSLLSFLNRPPWPPTCPCPSRRGPRRRLLTRTRRIPLALDLRVNCLLATWGSMRMRSLQCLPRSPRGSMRLSLPATPSPRRPRPIPYTRPRARPSRTPQPVLPAGQLIPRRHH